MSLFGAVCAGPLVGNRIFERKKLEKRLKRIKSETSPDICFFRVRRKLALSSGL